nr:ribonuclease H-like domain-containing protein [Tanacetum cinerariifolium]
MVRNVDSPSKFLMHPRFLQVVVNNQVDDLISHNTRYTSPALTQKVFANRRRVGKGFSGVETPLFASMLVLPQPQAKGEEEEVKMPNASAPPSLINAPSPPPQDPTPTPHVTPLQAQPSTPSASPSQEQPTTTFESSMSFLNSLMKTCATLRMHPNRGKIEAIDADEDITLVDVEKDEEVVDMDADLQGRIDQDVSTATKDVNAAEPTVFVSAEPTVFVSEGYIKMLVLLPRMLMLLSLLYLMIKSQGKTRKGYLERAKVLQQQYNDREENIDWNDVVNQVRERHLDNIIKYQNLKKKHVSIAQAKKNMIIYLKNMAGYKMEHFKGMTYDKESFKKLKAVEVSCSESTQETPSNDPKEMSEEDVQNMLEIVPVSEFKVEALQRRPGCLWNLVKEKFSSTVLSVDKEKSLWVELKRLFEPDEDDVLWKLQRDWKQLVWKLKELNARSQSYKELDKSSLSLPLRFEDQWLGFIRCISGVVAETSCLIGLLFLLEGDKPPKGKDVGSSSGGEIDQYDPLFLHSNNTSDVFMGQVFSKNAKRQYDSLFNLPDCHDNSDKLKKHNQLCKLMQFLMGLDEIYAPTSSIILTTDPDVKGAFATRSRDESQRGSQSHNVSKT